MCSLMLLTFILIICPASSKKRQEYHYIKTYRLNQACRLLENTQQKIVTISNLVGYPNCSYFIRSFMNHFGISPEKYRQQFKEAQNGGIE